MPRSYSQGSVFADNFIRGFAFVDEIKSRNRAEERLEDRLADEAEERSFQRRRTLESDRNVREDRATDRDERVRVEDVRKKREQGEQLALNPDVTNEELMPFASFSPSAKALLEKRMGIEEFKKAVAGVSTIPGAPGSAQSNLATSGPTRPSLSDAVAASQPGAQPQVDPDAAAAAAAGGSPLFQPSQGQSGVERVSEEDISRFDPEFQEKGLGGQVGDVIGGQVQQLTRGFGNLFDAVSGTMHPEGTVAREVQAPGPRAAGAGFAGDTFVPAEFVSKAEFDQIADPQEREAVATRNGEIIEEQKAKARNPNRNKLARPITRQGAVQEGGELIRNEAQQRENRVERVYTEFLEGNGGELEEAALAEPSVAAVDYFENRATLEETRPDMVEAVDRRMVPVLNAYAAQVQGELTLAQAGSAEARQLRSKMKNINASRDMIADDQAPVANQAGLLPAGLKIGDQERVDNVVATIYDAERPAHTSIKQGQLNGAIAIAGRITPRKRLNSNQIESLAILAEAGYMDKSAAFSIGMTGHWPPGKNPNEIKNTFKSGETTWAQTEGGGMFMLPDPIGDKKRADEDKDKNTSDRSIGMKEIESVLIGAASAGVGESRTNQVIGLMSDHAGWVRKHYNTDNQESMIAAGRALGQAVFLSGAETKRMADDSFFSFTNPKNAPTAEQIFLNPVLRERLATEYNERPVPMPAVGNRSDFDLEPFKASLREGVHGPQLQADVDSLDEDQLLYVYWALNATAEDIAAANAQGQ